MRALARDPDARYPSAGAFRAALSSVDLAPLDSRPDATATATTYGTYDPTTTYGGGDGYAGPERTWLVPAALIVVIAVTLGVVGIIVGQTDVGRGLFKSVGVSHDHPVTGVGATSFDPLGDGHENDTQVGLAVDGNPQTGWRTETYRSPLSQLKDGVGIVLHLRGPTSLADLTLLSPTLNWTAAQDLPR